MTALPAEPMRNVEPTLAVDPAVEGHHTLASSVAAAVSARYGPSALATPANLLTVARLAFSPLLLVMILRNAVSWPTFALGFVLAFSDGIDGHLARRHGTTRSGAFLDPLADKVLVLGALAALVAAHRFWIAPVLLIAAREVAISVYRTHLGRQGLAVPARTLGKLKTVVQELAVAIALFPPMIDHVGWATGVLWVGVVLTYVSGAQYLLDGRSAATTLGHRTPAA
jgi:CDP-diacylglycerol--glycerol-3-phosphate 3-phosphatidyltransferase